MSGLRIKIRLDRRSIAGRVVDAAGEPVVGAAVVASPEGMPFARGFATARSDLHGSFEVPDLADGTYSLSVDHVRGRASIQHVAAGRHALDVRLPALGRIQGTLVGFMSPPHVTAVNNSSAHGPQASVQGTHFAFRDLSPGTYRLRAQAPGSLALATVTVPADGDVSVTLTAQGLGAITGTLRDEKTGQPVANVGCWCDGANDAITDAAGAFHIEDVAAGPVQIACTGSAPMNVTLIAGQTVHVELTAPPRSRPRHGHAGLVLEQQLSDIIVESVEPGGPAERAGVLPGDILRAVDGEPVPDEYAIFAIESREIGTAAKLTIERGDQLLEIAVTVEAPR